MRTVVVGGTSGLGFAVAQRRAAAGDDVVVTGRDAPRAEAAAATIGPTASGRALDLAAPHTVADALGGLDRVDYLVIAAIDRDENRVAAYDIDLATRLATIKLVGYPAVVAALRPAMHDESAVVLFGGRAKDRPYPGSTTVSTVNGAVVGMVNTLAVELAPIRVNAIHPGVVGDSPFWAAKPQAVVEGLRSRTPTGRLATMADIAHAVDFLLTNPSVNGINLDVDGGWLLR